MLFSFFVLLNLANLFQKIINCNFIFKHLLLTLSIFKDIKSVINTISLPCTNNQIEQISGSQDFSSPVVSLWLINEKNRQK